MVITADVSKQLGIGGTFAIVLVWVILDMLVTAGLVTPAHSQVTVVSPEFKTAAHQIQQMYEWHDARDADGVLRWWVPRSTTVALNKLNDKMDEQTLVLRDIERALRPTP